MKVKMFGPAAGAGPHGHVISWGPDQVVDVDDDDEKSVAFYRSKVEAGAAELVEDIAKIHEPAEAKSGRADTAEQSDTGDPNTPYEERTVPQLQAVARKRRLPTSGSKEELISRLRGET